MGTGSRTAKLGPASTLGVAMLVDDDCMILESTTRLLNALGFEVIEAIDGQDAVEKYQTHPKAIAFVMMDICMPRMGGLEAARVIKEYDPSAKIILSSGFTDQPLADAKADAFLPKPYTGRALYEIIQRVMQGEVKSCLMRLGVYGTAANEQYRMLST